MRDGSKSADLGFVEEREPGRGRPADAVVGLLGGEQRAGRARAVGGGGLADGEPGVEQGSKVWVLADLAVVEGGAGETDRLAVAALDAGLQREIGPCAGDGSGIGGEQRALQGSGVQAGGLVGVAAVVGSPAG
ncbi:hypothetical protein [Streptomyces melanogenes]|uniref:hypothetical protein n=1 Tax=Streptomyces melanogenes TaxID=67326 RepID=UPI0037BA945F